MMHHLLDQVGRTRGADANFVVLRAAQRCHAARLAEFRLAAPEVEANRVGRQTPAIGARCECRYGARIDAP